MTLGVKSNVKSVKHFLLQKSIDRKIRHVVFYKKLVSTNKCLQELPLENRKIKMPIGIFI